MGERKKYRDIYKVHVIDFNCQTDALVAFPGIKENYEYRGFHHSTREDWVNKISTLMRKGLVFYCYGDDEIIEKDEKHKFEDLERLSTIAYQSRTPKRPENKDGLLGEVLLDLIIQIYYEDCTKLTTRMLFRQDDNFEVKGYDAAYFIKKDGCVSIWLGQSKFGGKNYCRGEIHKDLIKSFDTLYLSDYLYFISDKRVFPSAEARELLEIIDDLNFNATETTGETRRDSLLQTMKDRNISLTVPCLLAYGSKSVYKNDSNLAKAIGEEVKEFHNFYKDTRYGIEGIECHIMFFIFPIKDLGLIRGKGGFYDGLR